jgi:transposase
VELAWFWLRYQPDSALAQWFRARVGGAKGRVAKIMIVALARKLLIALWRFAKDGVIPEGATLLVREAFCRDFANRRTLGAYAGLTGTPFASGGMQREQGIGKDGNHRLRALIVELAWFWLRYQPDSALAQWFRARVGGAKGRVAKIMIVALARKLLIALWRFARDGVIPEGATMKSA